MNRKNIIVLVVILIVISISGYIIFNKTELVNNPVPTSQNSQTQAPSPVSQEVQKTTPQPSPTPSLGNKVSVCGTYQSDEFGFEFTCPDGWYVGTNDLHQKLGQTIYFVNDKSILTNQNGLGDFISGIDFSVEDNSKLLTLQQWMDKNIGFEGTSKPIKVLKP